MTLRKPLAGTVLLAALAVAVAPTATGPVAHAAAPTHSVVISGILQPGFGSDGSNLAILTPHRGLVDITTSSSTLVVRRYNGLSAYDELSAGDTISVVGVLSSTSTLSSTAPTTPTIVARSIKDYSIQKAFTRNYGVITAITTTTSSLSTITIRVLSDRFMTSPLRVGEMVHLQVSSTMSVTLGNGAMGTVASSLVPGEVITSLGVYNRKLRTFDSVSRIRVSTPHLGENSVVFGTVQAGFGTTLPTTVTLQTPFIAPFNTITVTLGTATRYVVGYLGSRATLPLSGYLARIQAGDRLEVYGTYTGIASYSAVTVHDSRVG